VRKVAKNRKVRKVTTHKNYKRGRLNLKVALRYQRPEEMESVTLKVTPRKLQVIRRFVEERAAKTSGREAEALRRVLEAFKKAENETDPEDSLKLELELNDAKILSRELEKIEEELTSKT